MSMPDGHVSEPAKIFVSLPPAPQIAVIGAESIPDIKKQKT